MIPSKRIKENTRLMTEKCGGYLKASDIMKVFPELGKNAVYDLVRGLPKFNGKYMALEIAERIEERTRYEN